MADKEHGGVVMAKFLVMVMRAKFLHAGTQN